MKSGSTGWSTGPHLHFEVRLNGVAVDSLPYITKKTDSNAEDEGNNISNENQIQNTALNNNSTN